MLKTCMLCKHLSFDPGEPDWPGWEAEGSCSLGRWAESGLVNWPRIGLAKAQDCDDFTCVENKYEIGKD